MSNTVSRRGGYEETLLCTRELPRGIGAWQTYDGGSGGGLSLSLRRQHARDNNDK